MIEDLASQSLGYTPANKLSLSERRANYETWLASCRLAARPPSGPIRIDDGPTTGNLADKRAQAGEDAASRLITPLPPGAVVRIDEGEEKPDISDDVRLGFAKSLLTKLDGADAETAERITKAATDIMGPLVRVDDAKGKDEEVDSPINGKGGGDQPKVPKKPGSSPLNRRDPANRGAHAADDDPDDGKERRLSDDDNDPGEKLTEILSMLKGLNGRLDRLEGKQVAEDDDDDDSGSEDNPVNAATLGKGEGAPRDLAADDSNARSASLKRRMKVEKLDEAICDWRSEDRFANFQAKADSIASLWGGHAAKPIAGEKLGSYKRRVVATWQSLSPTYKDVDLKVLQRADGVAFNAAISDILVHADSEGRRPTRVPLGHLAERTETKGGHLITTFHGRPISWMNQFMHRGKRIKQIVERNDSGGLSRTLYEAKY
jgi:hypothetical protein